MGSYCGDPEKSVAFAHLDLSLKSGEHPLMQSPRTPQSDQPTATTAGHIRSIKDYLAWTILVCVALGIVLLMGYALWTAWHPGILIVTGVVLLSIWALHRVIPR